MFLHLAVWFSTRSQKLCKYSSFSTSWARANSLLSYFVGFQEGNHGEFKGLWIELKWLLMYQLVIAPSHEWNLDLERVNTSHWRW